MIRYRPLENLMDRLEDAKEEGREEDFIDYEKDFLSYIDRFLTLPGIHQLPADQRVRMRDSYLKRYNEIKARVHVKS
ncbi:MAG: hypothetical protein JSW08_03100 [archaeon]|nr:MAG: hypothetical protein JSW08_03100 [archaeon]